MEGHAVRQVLLHEKPRRAPGDGQRSEGPRAGEGGEVRVTADGAGFLWAMKRSKSRQW